MGKTGATRVRYGVIAFAVILAVITYIHRVAISQAAPLITQDLHLSRVQMGAVFSAFTLAYALFEIPAGLLGDLLGARRVLAFLVVWWSFFTAASGWAGSLASLWIARFLVGMGQAGFFPNMTKAFTTWLPHQERVRGQGIMWMSARWGGAFTPWLVFWVLQFVTWRRAFELFGAAGCAAAAGFFLWYRDHPSQKKGLNAAERELLGGGGPQGPRHGGAPWGKFLRSGSVWLLCLQYFCLSYGWYFYISWLPTYLQEARRVEVSRSAVLAGLPLFLGGLGSFCGGFLGSYWARRTGSAAKARRGMAYLGASSATALLLAAAHLRDPVWAMLAMGLASFGNDLVVPGSWGACMDVGGRYAGTLSGAMNMMGNFGGALSPLVIGYILRGTGNNWTITFYVSAAIYFAAVIFWRFLDPVTPVEQEK
jgi:ACS family glucarate transporter-like MFS transporter